MTAICPGGGSSGPKPGIPALLSIASGALQVVLSRAQAEQLVFLIPFLGLPSLAAEDFCSVDPPSMPTLTSGEAEALLKLDLSTAFYSGIAKCKDLILHLLWYEFCQCDSGTASPATTVVLPPELPTPYGPPAPTAEACHTQLLNPTNLTANDSNGMYYLGDESLLPQVTSIRVTTKNTLFSGTGGPVHHRLQQIDPDDNVVREDDWDDALGTTSVHSFPKDYRMVYWWHIAGVSSMSGTVSVSRQWEMFCGTTPGAVQQPCCPPDPATQSYLDLLLNMVTLIQRQAVPFAYVYGDNHTDISGDGEISISGLVGVSVDVTTVPSHFGVEAGTPETHFDLGFVTLGTADGWSISRRVDHDGTLIMPTPSGMYTRVGYTLRPGVVVDIRELVREP